MKRIVLVYALLVAIVPAKAQTTNTQTNCQVIGNQIICHSQTESPVPLVAPELRKQIPPPPSTEALIRAAEAARRETAEAMGRDVERFTAELSSHDAWVSIKSGNSYHVRMSGDRIYILRIVPPGANWSQRMRSIAQWISRGC